VNVQAGKLPQAVAMIEEAQAITTATGSAPMAYASLVLLGWRGQEGPAFGLIDAILQEATARGEGMATTRAEYAAALVHNGHGRYGQAFASAQRASEHEEPGVSSWVLPELIEAATRSGRADVAAAALERFSQSTQASGTDWALGWRPSHVLC
jgi:hypothetical protein